MDREARHGLIFQVLNEIGIIQQLSAAEFNRRLPEDVHVAHFSVLNHMVKRGDGKTPVALAKAFQVTKATMTNTLIRLTQRGLVEVRDNPDDGRSKLVYLTASGRQFRDEAIASLQPMLTIIEAGVPAQTFADLLPHLQRLRTFLDDNRSG